MYKLLVIFILFHPEPTAAQNNEKGDRNDSCIVSINILSYKVIDSSTCLIGKLPVKDLIKKVEDCGNGYKYISEYRDKAFEFRAPRYLKNRFFTFGDNNFTINFYDTASVDNSTDRVVAVYYDFDSSYKKFFLNQIATGKQKTVIKKIAEKKLYLFTNWENKFCGKLFLENNTFIFYCTRDKKFEKELQKSILSFRWK
jgi:hypothetical protein